MVSHPSWATIASLATAGGTLILALATFASVRSSGRAARAAERSTLQALRPLLVPSRLDDPSEKIAFNDDHWLKVPGGHAAAETTQDAIYLAIALRNVGRGLAVLNSWQVTPERLTDPNLDRPDHTPFRWLSRDLYLPPSDLGFWQGALRDPTDPTFDQVAAAIRDREAFTVDVLYGDGEGGQRVISRHLLLPHADDDWLASVARHWNLDRAEPR